MSDDASQSALVQRLVEAGLSLRDALDLEREQARAVDKAVRRVLASMGALEQERDALQARCDTMAAELTRIHAGGHGFSVHPSRQKVHDEFVKEHSVDHRGLQGPVRPPHYSFGVSSRGPATGSVICSCGAWCEVGAGSTMDYDPYRTPRHRET